MTVELRDVRAFTHKLEARAALVDRASVQWYSTESTMAARAYEEPAICGYPELMIFFNGAILPGFRSVSREICIRVGGKQVASFAPRTGGPRE